MQEEHRQESQASISMHPYRLALGRFIPTSSHIASSVALCVPGV